MITNYKLSDDGIDPVPVNNVMEWAAAFDNKSRFVQKTELPNGVTISTVFLSLDHGFGDDGPPLVWETLVFGGPGDQEIMERCGGNRHDAVKMHQAVVAAVKSDWRYKIHFVAPWLTPHVVWVCDLPWKTRCTVRRVKRAIMNK